MVAPVEMAVGSSLLGRGHWMYLAVSVQMEMLDPPKHLDREVAARAVQGDLSF
jgi:hypothetical protein